MAATAMKQPKNVVAVMKWFREHMPSEYPNIERIVEDASWTPAQGPRTAKSSVSEAMLALVLQGFEAGREFQKDNPDVVSGSGYMP